jgi:hypothetical protein
LFRRDADDETRMVLSQNGGAGEEGQGERDGNRMYPSGFRWMDLMDYLRMTRL